MLSLIVSLPAAHRQSLFDRSFDNSGELVDELGVAGLPLVQSSIGTRCRVQQFPGSPGQSTCPADSFELVTNWTHEDSGGVSAELMQTFVGKMWDPFDGLQRQIAIRTQLTGVLRKFDPLLTFHWRFSDQSDSTRNLEVTHRRQSVGSLLCPFLRESLNHILCQPRR